MPKPITNNRINGNNVYGRVIVHDGYLNQGVTSNDSPTFANIYISGDANVAGNLYVDGNVTTLDTDVIQLKDNIIVINYAETGAGVTLNQAGIEVERGTLENYRFVYEESSNEFKAGVVSNLHPVAIREDTSINNGIFVWNDTTKLLETTNTLPISLNITNTENSFSSSTGSITTLGGIGVAQDIFIDGMITINSDTQLVSTAGNFNIESSIPIKLVSSNVILNDGTLLELGSSIIQTGTDLNITTSNLNIQGNSVSIPQDSEFRLGSGAYISNSSSNLLLNSSSIIHLDSAVAVEVNQNIPLRFGSGSNQRILSNGSNDLLLYADNNIILTPGNGLDVRIPSDNSLKFGNTGNQKITSNTNDNLVITATGDIVFQSKINAQSITFSSIGNITSSGNDLEIINTSGNIVLGDSVKVNGMISVNDTLVITDGTAQTVIATVGDGSNIPSLKLSSDNNFNGKNLIDLNAGYDTVGNYIIGRGSSVINDGRIMTFNIPSYADYGSTGSIPKISFTTDNCNTELFSVDADGNLNLSGPALSVTSTENSYSSTTGSFIITGGLGLAKNLYSDGEIVNSVDSTSALLVRTSIDTPVFGIDTVNTTVYASGAVNIVTLNTAALSVNSDFVIDTVSKVSTFDTQVFIQNTTSSADSSTGALIVSGGAAISENLNVSGMISGFSGANLNNTKLINLLDPTDPQDAATKNYVDLVKSGLDVKDSVDVATITNGNLATDFVTGSTIDNYVLSLGDRILLKNQTSSIENGIYIVTNSTPTRTTDLPDGDYAAGSFVFVKYGDINSALGWICNSPATSIVGTDPISFTEFTGVGNLVAGNGLVKTGNQIDIIPDDFSIYISGNQLRIKSTGLGTGLTGGSGSQIETSYNQSHVTMLGNINSGSWNASTIDVAYGGTGRNNVPVGYILFGDGTNPLNYNSQLFYDTANNRLCIGGTLPQEDLHVQNTDTTTLMIESDTDNANPDARPEIRFSYANGGYNDYIGISRLTDDYALGVLPQTTVISNEQNAIQFATQNIVRMTVTSDGNVIIPNTEITLATINNLFVTNDVSILGNLNLSGSVSNSEIALSSTEGALNPTTGALISEGGITILSSYDSVDLNNGGSILTYGGASVNKTLRVGGSIIGLADAYIDNIYIWSSTSSNYIMSPDPSRTTDSFMPLKFRLYNGTEDLMTVSTSGTFINSDLQIGESGYTFSFSTVSNILSIDPLNVSDKILFNSRVDINDGFSADNNLTLTNWDLVLQNTSGSRNIVLNGIDNSGDLFINTTSNSSANIIIGQDGVSETNFILSSKLGSDTVSFTPSESTNSNLTTSSGVDVYINGNLNLGSDINYSLGGKRVDITNSSTSSLWVFLGKITDSFELFIRNESGESHILGDTSGAKVSTVGETSEIYLYDNLSSELFLFSKIPQTKSCIFDLKYALGDAFNFYQEGVGVNPNGSVSGWTGSWTPVNLGNNKTTVGESRVLEDAYFYGNVLEINYSTGNLDAAGILFNRNAVSGITVYDIPQEIDTIPDQSIVPNTQIKLSTSANTSDDYYNGWYINVNSEIVRITAYNGAQRVANLSSAVSASTGNIVDLYDKSECGLVYSETAGSFFLAYTPQKTFSQYHLADLILNDLNSEIGYFNNGISSGNLNVSSAASFETTVDIASGMSVGNYLNVNGTAQISDSISVAGYLFYQTGGSLVIDSSSGNEMLIGPESISISGNLYSDALYGYSNSGLTVGTLTFSTSGDITLSTSSEGSLNLFTGSGFNYLSADSSGNLLVNSNTEFSNTVLLSDTSNSTNATTGGALTVLGGASIAKDLYIDGDLFVSGILASSGNATTPSLTISDYSNCSLVEYINNNMISTNTLKDLWVSVALTPSASGVDCEFTMSLPDRTTTFVKSGEALVFITGYDSNYNAVFNCVGYALIGDTKIRVKFGSNSTTTHYVSLKVNYTGI